MSRVRSQHHLYLTLAVAVALVAVIRADADSRFRPRPACPTAFQALAMKKQLQINQHISIRGADGTRVEARIVAADENSMAVLIDGRDFNGPYRRLGVDELASVGPSSDTSKVPRSNQRTSEQMKDRFLKWISQPIGAPPKFTDEEFRAIRNDQLDYLKAKRVDVRDGDAVDMLTRVNEQMGIRRPSFVNTIRRVVNLPVAAAETHRNASAFLHREMPEKLKELERGGYKLVVDLTLPVTGSGAYLDPDAKFIALSGFSTWEEFVHEFEHFRVERFISKRDTYLQTLATGSADAVLPKEITDILGPEKLGRINQMQQSGMPEQGWDETMAVDAQLRMYGFARYTAKAGYYYRAYALRHQADALLEVENRTPAQDRLLNQALQKRVLNAVARKAVSPVGMAVIGGGAYYGVDSMIYSEESELVYAQTADGTWVVLRRQTKP